MVANNDPVTAQSREFAPGDTSCWEYYLKNTEKYGDYTVFALGGRDHKRSEFIGDVEALAAFFKKELGFKERDVFTVFMPTNAESMITFMALNKIGVIVNFVHPLLPPDNVAEILDDTASKGVMLLDMFAPKYIKVIADHHLPCIVCAPKEYAYPDKCAAKADPAAVASIEAVTKNYYIYPEILKKFAGQTVPSIPEGSGLLAAYMNGGGTTGKSKTIKLSDYAFNNVTYMLAGLNTPVENIGYDTELCAMPFFHAFGFCAGGLSALNKGSRVIFIPKFDSAAFVELMKTNHVVEFNGVPNMYRKLISDPTFDDPHLGNIKVMYSGGDYVSPVMLRKIHELMRKHGSNAEFCQGYGLTECCAVCTVNPPWANKPGTIGKPLPGLRIEIWDEDKKPVPAGELGEIVITGPTLMEGYLTKDGPKDLGLYVDDNGTKWVLTGDLGRSDEEGYITFVGRKKRVIIISGYNVYPVDIEQLITELPFIRESCAVQGYVDGKPIVRLFVVLAKDGDQEAYKKQITDLIGSKLPVFDVPRDIQFIDELPCTRLLKVDFMKLSEFAAAE